MVFCGGYIDIFHLCKEQLIVTQNLVCEASEFFHLPLLFFFVENGAELNAKGNDVSILNLIGLLFKKQQKMVILVLLII